jgi:aspartate kinase
LLFLKVADEFSKPPYSRKLSIPTENSRPNLTQNGAISFTAVFDDKAEKLGQLAEAAAATFDEQMQKGLHLLTIRHYNAAAIERLMGGKTLVLEQKTTTTIQAVCLQSSTF